MKAARFAGPMMVVLTMVILGGCGTTPGTAQSAATPTQGSTQSAATPTQGSTQSAATPTQESTQSAAAPTQESTATAEGGSTRTDPPGGAVSSGTEPAGSDTLGTRDAPLNPGTKADLGTAWTVGVGVTNLDSWSAIKEIDESMDEPASGRAYVSAPLTLTFNGSGNSEPAFDMNYAFVGSKGNVFSDDCSPYDVSLFRIGDMYSGAQGEAMMCISVPKDQAAGGVWRIQYFDDESFDKFEAFYSTA